MSSSYVHVPEGSQSTTPRTTLGQLSCYSPSPFADLRRSIARDAATAHDAALAATLAASLGVGVEDEKLAAQMLDRGDGEGAEDERKLPADPNLSGKDCVDEEVEEAAAARNDCDDDGSR